MFRNIKIPLMTPYDRMRLVFKPLLARKYFESDIDVIIFHKIDDQGIIYIYNIEEKRKKLVPNFKGKR